MQGLTKLPLRILVAAALGVAGPAWSISLGDVDVRSALGEPLDARVPLTVAPGEAVDANCFVLAGDGGPGIPLLTDGSLTVESVPGRAALRIRSSAPVFEPAVRLRVRAGCPGAAAEPPREYSILLDARPGSVAADVPVITTTLEARSGDTLRSLATDVFPRNRAVRARYLQAMREANPALASLGDTDPIAAGTQVALPDLRTFGRGLHTAKPVAHAPRKEAAAPTPSAPRTASAPPKKSAQRESIPQATPESERKSPARTETSRAAPSPAAPASKSAPPSGDFVLRLSTGSMDLARSRAVDDRTRAELRERLTILDSDDQVAAVLALRHRLTQLEQRVSELQLKLAQMPASFPERPATQPAKAAPQKPAPEPLTEAPKPAVTQPPKAAAAGPPKPAVAEPPKPAVAQPPKAAAAEPPKAAAAEPPKPAAAPEPVKERAPAVEAKPEAAKSSPPAPSGTAAPMPPKTASKPVGAIPRNASTEQGFDLGSLWHSYGLWAALAAILILLVLLLRRMARRSEPEYESDEEEWEQPATTEPHAAEANAETTYDPQATLALEAPDADALRKRYIEERFPEVTSGVLSFDDPASVVKNARLLYEDGAPPRAVELLNLAIEERPREARPWLALFEIYRLERMTGEFADLARRYHEHFGEAEPWRKIRYFGRELDPGNFLYREDVDAIETITPATVRKERERFDPVRENWLDVPMGFDDQVLANELRQALMAGAGLVEQDLVPNPMPALRDAEMFTVA